MIGVAALPCSGERGGVSRIFMIPLSMMSVLLLLIICMGEEGDSVLMMIVPGDDTGESLGERGGDDFIVCVLNTEAAWVVWIVLTSLTTSTSKINKPNQKTQCD